MSDQYEARMALWGYALPRHTVDGGPLDPRWDAQVDATWLSVMHDVDRGLREGRIERVTIDATDRGLFIGWVRVAKQGANQ